MLNVGKKMRAISALFVELVGVAGFEPATPSSRTRECGFHPLKYQRFSIASVPIRSRSIHAKLWPTCGRLATGAGGHRADVGSRVNAYSALSTQGQPAAH